MNKIRFLKTGIIAFVMCICASGASAAPINFSNLGDGYMEAGLTYTPASEEYTGTSDSATPAVANAYFNIFPGYYIPASSSSSSRVATICPTRSYCPGVEEVSPAETSSAIGAIACDTSEFYSDAGSISVHDCYRSCNPRNLLCLSGGVLDGCSVAGVKSVTGRFFQDTIPQTGTEYFNSCTVTSCNTGYSVNDIDFTAAKQGSFENIWFLYDWGYDQHVYRNIEAGTAEGNSPNYTPQYMTDSYNANYQQGAWAVSFTKGGNRYEYDGVSYCIGSEQNTINPYNDILNQDERNVDSFKFCYCALKQYVDYAAQTTIPILGGAVYITEGIDRNDCKSLCPEACAEVFAEQNNDGILKMQYQSMALVEQRCTPNSYEVSFNVNGGSGGQSTKVTATYNSPMPAISSTPPTRTGYMFGGWWDLSADSGGTKYYNVDGTSAHIWDKSRDATLYARWVTNTHTVSFDVNGGSGGQSTNVTATYGQSMPPISSTAPTRTGYTFGGWWDTNASSGGTQYYATSGASAHTWDKTENTTLYARWTPKKIYITWGNVNSLYSQTHVDYDGDIQTPSLENVIQREGQEFIGWKFLLPSGN